jgi:quercetin dioxygenase-like cupin family protein
MTSLSVSQPILSTGPDAAALDHLSMLARVRLDAAQTGGALGLVEERASQGACTPAHRHAREAETFVVLDGALEGWADGSLTRVEAGAALYLPPGVPHAFRVISQTAHFLLVVTPGGFESFFPAVGRPHPGGFGDTPPEPGPPPTDEQVAALAGVLAPLGVEITGPPPF